MFTATQNVKLPKLCLIKSKYLYQNVNQQLIISERSLFWTHKYHFKGTHTVYFSSSLYIINQKPTISRTHFIA